MSRSGADRGGSTGQSALGSGALGAPPGGADGRRALLDWYWREARDLPWRRTRDRWAVLVSETMLRQTQASRVAERFPVLLAAFPTPAAMAEASLEDVLRLWEGLGYYRRARDLWRSAQQIVADHDGVVPAELGALSALPGVGRYTARAVLTFADGRPVGAVDTNVRRMLSRWAGRTLSLREAEEWADRLCREGDAWSWNQAVMELGACCCTARGARCGSCPVAGWCPSAGRPDRVELGVRRPSPFPGSDRQAAARLLRALLRGPVALDDVEDVTGFGDDGERARRVAARLVADGMVAARDGWLLVVGSGAAGREAEASGPTEAPGGAGRRGVG